MDMKEKLVELIQGNTDGFVNPYAYEYSENAEQFADYLIANGIGFVTDNNVGSKWIPVTERLPGKGEIVLACGLRHATSGMFQGASRNNPRWWNWKGNTLKEVTHWMPLPEPPKEEAQPDCTYNKNGRCIGQKLMPECDAKNCNRRK